MNKKLLIGLAAIILVGVGVYVFVVKGGASGGYGPTTTVPVGGGSNSIESLVAAGSPVVCTFATTTQAGKETGTIYIASGMVSGDFAVTDTAAGNLQAHMLVQGSTSYTWTSASNQGFKSTVSTSTNSANNQGVSYSAQMDYSCQAWVPDSSKFNLPTDVSFTATAAYVPPTQGAGATGAGAGVQGTAAQCAQCNQLSGAPKAQCLAALSCK